MTDSDAYAKSPAQASLTVMSLGEVNASDKWLRLGTEMSPLISLPFHCDRLQPGHLLAWPPSAAMDDPLKEREAMENVWDYPRPPALEPVLKLIRIEFAGRTIAATEAAFRVLETSHPPVYYLPRAAFTHCTLEAASGRSACEWKGEARYWTIRVGDRVAERAAWSYPDPTPAFEAIRDHLAVYAGAMDRCFVGDEAVTPQPGGFYGGWITRDLQGPFKGGPGSMGW